MDEQGTALTPLSDELSADVAAFSDASQFKGKLAKSALRYATAEQSAMLLVGIGERHKLNGNALQKIAKVIYSQLADLTKHATLWLGGILEAEQFGQLTLALMNQDYRFEKAKAKPQINQH